VRTGGNGSQSKKKGGKGEHNGGKETKNTQRCSKHRGLRCDVTGSRAGSTGLNLRKKKEWRRASHLK